MGQRRKKIADTNHLPWLKQLKYQKKKKLMAILIFQINNIIYKYFLLNPPTVLYKN